jgi:hypothetical protein
VSGETLGFGKSGLGPTQPCVDGVVNAAHLRRFRGLDGAIRGFHPSFGLVLFCGSLSIHDPLGNRSSVQSPPQRSLPRLSGVGKTEVAPTNRAFRFKEGLPRLNDRLRAEAAPPVRGEGGKPFPGFRDAREGLAFFSRPARARQE